MGTNLAKSAAITNRDATPRQLSNDFLVGDRVKHARGVVTIVNGDTSPSTYRALMNIPSNAVPISVRISAPDIGTTTTADVGLYKATADGGAVVDSDFFKAAVVLNAGAISKSEVLFGNVVTVAKSEQRIWELLGLTADPFLQYDVVLSLVGAADAGGAVLVEMDYVQ